MSMPQYPNQPQFQPGQFPGGPFPPQGPAPSDKKKVLVFSLIGVAVVAVIALVVVLVWQPSKDDVLTAELDRGITVEVAVPEGWRASREAENDKPGILVTPEGEARSADRLLKLLDDFSAVKSGEDVHMITIHVQSCGDDTSDSWKLGEVMNSRDFDVRITHREMMKRVSGKDCVFVLAVDAGVDSVSSMATDVLEGLSKGDAITATFDAERSKAASPSR